MTDQNIASLPVHPVPWISFCIATYRRPAILGETLAQIRQQSFADFEVIVSDNDPEQSSRQVVEAMRDERFTYFGNQENVGMVKNFNRALQHAHGEFIVMIADDDPPQFDFLQTMHDLWQSQPGYGIYFGACEVVIASQDAADAYQTKMGAIRFLADAPENAIRCYSREQFPQAYFERKVFPYTLWSTGIVRRDIAMAVGGMPDYGSPLLTDLSYIAVVGSYAGCATINKVLGGQIVHGGNSGLVDPHNAEVAVTGCYQYLQSHLSPREDWTTLRPHVENFLCSYIANHCAAMAVFFTKHGLQVEIEQMQTMLTRISQLPYMQDVQVRYLRTRKINMIKGVLRPIIPLLKWVRGLLINRRS